MFSANFQLSNFFKCIKRSLFGYFLKTTPKFPRFGSRRPTPERDLRGEFRKGKKINSRNTRRVIDKNRERGFISRPRGLNNAEQIEELVRELQGKGIFIPRIEAFDKPNNLIVFQNTGESIWNRITKSWGNEGPDEQQKREASGLFLKAVRHLARLHLEGIAHGHPQLKNFVIVGNKVGTIDYKFAAKTAFDWNNLSKLNVQLANDWFRWRVSFLKLRERYPTATNFLAEQEKKTLAKLVSRYPITKENKRILQKQLTAFTLGEN